MPTQQIILSNDARQTFRTSLNGQNVRITAWWQPIDFHWYLTMGWLDGRGIIAGIRLVEGGQPLNGVITDFQGTLRVDGMGKLDRLSWETTHKLLYDSP